MRGGLWPGFSRRPAPDRVRDEKGQALVEFALVIPLLILLVFGVIEFGRLLSGYLTIQHAAREGVRLGITVAGDAYADTLIDSKVRDISATLEGSADPARLTISVAPAAGQRTPGSELRVTVQYKYNISVVPLIGMLFSGQLDQNGYLPLTSAISMRI